MAQQKKVLIVEDDVTLRQIYKEYLEQQGFEVSIAVDGEEGIRQIKAVKPDIVLLDLIMPKVSGFEVLEAVKNNEDTKNIAILVMTNIYSDTEELVKKGAASCLMKSDVTPDKVLKKINEILSVVVI